MYLSVAFVTVLLFETRWGLRVRSVGEHPTAADTVGINVNRMRWQAVLLGGVFAGSRRCLLHVGSTGCLRPGRLGRQRLHRARRGDHGSLAPGLGRRFAAVFFGFMWTCEQQLALLDKFPAG